MQTGSLRKDLQNMCDHFHVNSFFHGISCVTQSHLDSKCFCYIPSFSFFHLLSYTLASFWPIFLKCTRKKLAIRSFEFCVYKVLW